MSVTATYLTDLSRVRVEFTGAPAGADTALVERSTDGITWAPVRGGLTVPVDSGAGHVDDYEFAAAVLNTYRVSYVDNAPPAVVAAGAVASGNNTSVTPALPAGLVVNHDLLVIVASIRNSGTGTVNTPAGWTRIMAYGNTAMLARRYTTGVTAPLVTFAGGVAGADTIARMVSIRNAALDPVAFAQALNGSQQNMPYPAITTPVAACMALFLFWKQDDWTTLTPAATWGDPVTAGDDAGQAIYPIDLPAAGVNPGGVITVTGGGAAISRVAVAAFQRAPYISQETATATPFPDSVWLKFPSRPAQNCAITVTDFGDITRPDRGAEHDVVGRTLPVAITDVMGSRRFLLTIMVADPSTASEMDSRLALGEPVFIHAPAPDCVIPTLYAVIKGTTQRKASKRGRRRYFDLPLVESAAPGPTVAGGTITWADVIATYATWADVIAAKATWADLIDTVVVGEVIVP